MVDLVEALANGLEPGEGLNAFLEEHQNLLGSMDYFVCENDQALHGRAQETLSQLYVTLTNFAGGACPSTAHRVGVLAFRLARQVRQLEVNRRRTYFVDIEPVDALLVAGVACCQGRAAKQAVLRRLAPAAAEVEVWGEVFEQWQEELTSRQVASLEKGFLELTGALGQLERDPTSSSGLSRLRSGAQKVARLRVWEAELMGVEPSAIPLVGEVLHQSLDEPQECLLLLEELEDYWQDQPAQTLLPLQTREVLLNTIEENLRCFRRELELGRDLYSAVFQLEASFAALEHATLDPQRAEGTSYERVVQVLVAAWQKGVPDLSLRNFARSVAEEGPGSLLRATLFHYLRERDPDYLVAALEHYLDLAEAELNPDLGPTPHNGADPSATFQVTVSTMATSWSPTFQAVPARPPGWVY